MTAVFIVKLRTKEPTTLFYSPRSYISGFSGSGMFRGSGPRIGRGYRSLKSRAWGFKFGVSGVGVSKCQLPRVRGCRGWRWFRVSVSSGTAQARGATP